MNTFIYTIIDIVVYIIYILIYIILIIFHFKLGGSSLLL